MNGRAFKLGTFAKSGGKPFTAIVLDDSAIPLQEAADAYRGFGRKVLSTEADTRNPTIQGLLDDWDANSKTMQEIVAFLDKDGARPGASACHQPHRAPAGRPPGQDVLRRAELPGACRRDASRRHVAEGRPAVHRREIHHQALPVPEGVELPRRRHRRHRDPARAEQDRLGGRDRLRHLKAGQARHRPPARSTTSPAG